MMTQEQAERLIAVLERLAAAQEAQLNRLERVASSAESIAQTLYSRLGIM